MRSFALTATLLVVVAACGGGGGSSDVQHAPLDEVADLKDGTAVQITGALFVTLGTRLCGSVAESYPPQCGEPSVELRGLDAQQVVGLSSPSDPTFAPVTWTDYPLSVIGVVNEGSVEVTAVDQPTYGSQAYGSQDEALVEVRLGVNTPVGLESGAAVWWSLEITNTSTENLLLTFGSGKAADVTLLDDDGREAYRWSEGMMFTQALRDLDLAPGATYSTVLSGELSVEAGSYRIEGFFVAPQVSSVVAQGTIDISG